MARIRSVKPEICESEVMALLPAEVERTFVRLWTHCDDEGRARDHPKLLKAALFPLHDDVTEDDIDRHLEALEAKGLVRRYEVDGKWYLAVTNWAEHQKPQKPRPSTLPPVPEGYATPPVPVPEQDEKEPESEPDGGVRDEYATPPVAVEACSGVEGSTGEGVEMERQAPSSSDATIARAKKACLLKAQRDVAVRVGAGEDIRDPDAVATLKAREDFWPVLGERLTELAEAYPDASADGLLNAFAAAGPVTAPTGGPPPPRNIYRVSDDRWRELEANRNGPAA